MQVLGIAYEHLPVSVLRMYDEFRNRNPLVKAPTLVCDDGEILVESSLIIDYLESLAGRSLMPADGDRFRSALQIIGVALVSMEKVVQRIYELRMRPEELRHLPWLDRVTEQLVAAIDSLEASVSNRQGDWLFGDALTQADISSAVAWRFVNHEAREIAERRERPALTRFCSQAEALPEFKACPL